MALKGSGNIAVLRTVFVIDLALRSAVRMSALGQKRTCAAHKPMSALPPIADIGAQVDTKMTRQLRGEELLRNKVLAHRPHEDQMPRLM